MTALPTPHCPSAFSRQILPRVEAKLLASKTYQQAIAAFDIEQPPARTVLDAHLRAVARTSARLAFAELQADGDLEPTPPAAPPVSLQAVASTSIPQIPPPPAANPREAACQAVGSALQQARLARSLSLEQLAAKTLIQPHRIAALEAGQLAQVEDDIYLRGFIRRLAQALALDPPELLAMLPETPPPVRPSWYQDTANASSEPSALRYVSYAAAVAALVGGLAWAAEQAAAAPTAPAPQALSQVQPLRAAVTELPELPGRAIAPPEVA